MNNREHWSPEELAMQKAMDRIREEHPDFLNDLSDLSDFSDLPGEPMEPEKTADAPKVGEEVPAIEVKRRIRKKFRRRLIVACSIGVFLLSTFLTIFVNSDTCHAIKFAMEKKYYQAKGWVQATNPDRVSDENMMIIIETDESKIHRYEEFWEPLMYPGYMTDGYKFDELYVEKYINGMGLATFNYENNDNSIVITIASSDNSNNKVLWVTTEDVRNGECEYKVWYDTDTKNNWINIIIGEAAITIRGPIDIGELKKIVNGMN